MPKKRRLSEVIDSECLHDGDKALEAFESMSALERRYPKVSEAIAADAELRSMMNEEVLQKIAKPYLEEKLAHPTGASTGPA